MAEGYRGVRARGNSIVFEFQWNGQRCRESIYIGKPPTITMLKNAEDKICMIRYEIGLGQFDYLKHFPNSKTKVAKALANTADRLKIKDALKAWEIRATKKCQRSTMKSYSSAVYHYLIPAFGDLTLAELKPTMVKKWMSTLKISNKRINNTLIPLRQVFRDAFEDELIDSNPMDRIRNLPIDHKEPKPFTLREIAAILGQLEGQERNLIQFAFWSGLRTSELIALRWEDIDFENNRFYVRQAKVAGQLKTTKTKSGLRTVDLNEKSRAALEDQKNHTEGSTFVFMDSLRKKPWKNDQPIRMRVWQPALKKARIEKRTAYQTRHTFASQMLCAGKNPLWVAQQMGHSDWGMIRTVYGKWIPQNDLNSQLDYTG